MHVPDSPPRVVNNPDVHAMPASTLLQHNNIPKNARFRNKGNNNCRLRSKSVQIIPTMVAQHLTHSHHYINHICTKEGKKETIDSLLNGPNKNIWEKSLRNDWGRLAQGNMHGVRHADTIDFVHKHEVPSDSKVTCVSYVCDYHPLKEEPFRVRITAGGDRLTCDSDAGSPLTNLLETKIILNSTISDARKGTRFMSLDIKDHFYSTPVENQSE